MTQEDKELILVDLCARLPYHPILNWKFIDNTSKDEELKELSDLYIWWITKAQDCEVKPYLRPMSNMTEEEKVQLIQYACIGEDLNGEFIDEVQRKDCAAYIDWLNKHHFDYRGLIERGLAIEALEGMYSLKVR